jgi:hypothetical protein
MTEKINYPVKRMRLSEDTWKNLQKSKNKFGKSWNLFQVRLLELYKKYEQENK